MEKQFSIRDKNTREDKCSFYTIYVHEFSNQQEEHTSKMVPSTVWWAVVTVSLTGTRHIQETTGHVCAGVFNTRFIKVSRWTLAGSTFLGRGSWPEQNGEGHELRASASASLSALWLRSRPNMSSWQCLGQPDFCTGTGRTLLPSAAGFGLHFVTAGEKQRIQIARKI